MGGPVLVEKYERSESVNAQPGRVEMQNYSGVRFAVQPIAVEAVSPNASCPGFLSRNRLAALRDLLTPTSTKVQEMARSAPRHG